MFDFAWSEIALIGVVALVLIGPKDLPVAVKAVTDMVKRARRMAAEFQSNVDEMVKDTELANVRQQINEIRNFDIRGEVERAVDADGSIRRTFAEDPLRSTSLSTPVETAHQSGDLPSAPSDAAPPIEPPAADAAPAAAAAPPEADEPPPFIPPAFTPAGPERIPAPRD